MTHARKVLTGMSGSSVFATADRTSGYGESSSSPRRTSQSTSFSHECNALTENNHIRVKVRIVKLGLRYDEVLIVVRAPVVVHCYMGCIEVSSENMESNRLEQRLPCFSASTAASFSRFSCNEAKECVSSPR